MTYAHLFHELFGFGALDWFDDRFTYSDFLWMKAQADEEIRRSQQQPGR